MKPCARCKEADRLPNCAYCRSCRDLKNRQYLLDHPDYYTKRNKANAESGKTADYYLQKRYGISLETYEQMLREQDGKCAICDTEEPRGIGRFHVDHDHVTGKVRRLLCNDCNIGLGSFKDDPDRLRKAATYLEKMKDTNDNYRTVC